MSRPEAQKRRRISLVALGLSAGAHAALFWALSYGAHHARLTPPTLRPLEVRVIAPRAAVAATPAPTPLQVVESPRRRALPASAAEGRANTDGSPSAVALPPPAAPESGREATLGGPRRLLLAPPQALGGRQIHEAARDAPSRAPDGSGVSASDDAKARIDAWGRAYNESTAARVGGASGSLATLAAGVLLEFRPDPETLRAAGRFGIGALSVAESYLNTVRRQGNGGVPEGDPSTAKLRDSQMFPATSELSLSVPIAGSHVSICLGTCGDESHLVSSLAVTVRILHDGSGRPRDRTVLASSGDPRFDAAALTAVDQAAATLGAEALEEPPLPLTSEWELSAKAYRYTRGELLLDPLFVPPGEVIDSDSGVLGKTTLLREVRLVAVVYAEKRRR